LYCFIFLDGEGVVCFTLQFCMPMMMFAFKGTQRCNIDEKYKRTNVIVLKDNNILNINSFSHYHS